MGKYWRDEVTRQLHKTGARLRFWEAVGLLHPANIFPRPGSTPDFPLSSNTLFLLPLNTILRRRHTN
nr:hypothetical protein [Escherichia coli]